MLMQMKRYYDYEFIVMLRVFDKAPKPFGRLEETAPNPEQLKLI